MDLNFDDSSSSGTNFWIYTNTFGTYAKFC